MVKRSSLHVAGAVNVVVNAAMLVVVTVEAALNSMAGAGVAKGPAKSRPAAGAIPCGDKAIMSFFWFFFLWWLKECGVYRSRRKINFLYVDL